MLKRPLKINVNYLYFMFYILLIIFPLIMFNLLFNIEEYSFYGYEFSLVYYFMFIIILFLYLKTKNYSYIWVLYFGLYKVFFGIFNLFLMYKRYSGGDFDLYYDSVVNYILGNNNFLIYPNIAARITKVIFTVIPHSIIFLVLFTAFFTFISYLNIYKIIERKTTSERNLKLLIIYLFFLSPTLIFQNSYVGKEYLSLFLLSLFFLVVDKIIKNENRLLNYLISFLIIFLLSEIRIYQGLILLTTFIFWILFKKMKFRWVNILLIISFLIIEFFSEYIVNLVYPSFGRIGIREVMALAYQGGSLMLEPYIFPFNFLQIFRPFPWEANNLFSLITSLELFILFIIFIYYLIKKRKKIKINFQNSKFFSFLYFYVLIASYIYSLDPNMGDLSRRRVYFFPFIFLMFMSFKKEVEYGKSTNTKLE